MPAGNDARTRNANAFDRNNDDSLRHARSQQWVTPRRHRTRPESVAGRVRRGAALRNPWLFTQSAAKTKLK